MISLDFLETTAKRLPSIHAKLWNEMKLMEKISISRHTEGCFADPQAAPLGRTHSPPHSSMLHGCTACLIFCRLLRFSCLYQRPERMSFLGNLVHSGEPFTSSSFALPLAIPFGELRIKNIFHMPLGELKLSSNLFSCLT